MAHRFDSKAFQQLLPDVQSSRDLASHLERALARLARPDEGRSASQAGVANRSVDLDEALKISGEQAQLADRMLRRLLEPVTADTRDKPLVLVVDDSQDSCDATALLLEQAGFRAITAANGVEALIVAHYARPAIALLDLMMPVLDGLQTARILSDSPSTRHVKVIAYTGRADMFSRRLPGTFLAILAKPTNPEELLTLVKEQTGVPGGPRGL